MTLKNRRLIGPLALGVAGALGVTAAALAHPRTAAGGVRTTTQSDVAAVAAELREHVRAMYARLKDHRPINGGDPLFAALFKKWGQD